MRGLFATWLKSYKEYSENKAINIVTLIDKMSDYLVITDPDRIHFFCMTKYMQFAKNRHYLASIYSLSNSEKKAMELYGDFLQVMEISHPKIECVFESQLIDYIKTMRMSYSYKAIVLLALLEIGKAAHIDTLTTDVIKYYQDRIEKDLPAEREQSVFSNRNVSNEDAKKVLISNPIKVLCDSNVILYNEQINTVALTSAFLPYSHEVSEAKELLNNRLFKYYEGLITVCQVPSEIEEALKLINYYISAEEESQECQVALKVLKQKVVELYKRNENNKQYRESTEERKEFSPISENDERKVGKLVRETMSMLSASGYIFEEQLLKQLLDKEFSKKSFNVNYPFFREYDPDKPLNDQRKDYNGQGRYWSVVFSFGEKKLLITSEWYIEDRSFFIKWFNNNIAYSAASDS